MIGSGDDLKLKFQTAIHALIDNMDPDDPEFITIQEAFRQRFKEHGFTIDSMAKFNEQTAALDEILQKLKVLENKNRQLLKKYNGDTKFARVHKRIREGNEKRKQENKQVLFSQYDDEINENLWISVQTPQIKTDLNTYYSNSMKKIAEISDNFKEISYTDIEVNWIKWKSVIYESTQWDTIIKSQQTVFIDDDNKVYILQYTATKSTFDKYLNTINWIIKSFEVLN